MCWQDLRLGAQIGYVSCCQNAMLGGGGIWVKMVVLGKVAFHSHSYGVFSVIPEKRKKTGTSIVPVFFLDMAGSSLEGLFQMVENLGGRKENANLPFPNT